MAPRLSVSEVWWARELVRIGSIASPSTLRLLSDDAVDELHSVATRISNMLTNEYRGRMGVLTDEVPEVHGQ